MGFLERKQVAEPFETWPRLHGAAWERFWDGLELGSCRNSRNKETLVQSIFSDTQSRWL